MTNLLTDSLQFRLALSLSLIIAVATAIGGTIGYQSAFHDAYELQDDQLREISAMIDAKRIDLEQTDPIVRVGIVDKEAHIAIQILDGRPPGAAHSTEAGVAFPQDLPLGMQSYKIPDAKTWRVFVSELKNGKRLAVAQRESLRNEIARHAAWRTVMPLIILIPITVAAIIILLRVMLAPMIKLAAEIDGRNPNDLVPLDERGLPSEITPFVKSINQMLARLGTAMEQQRRFVADAAHELRSPLTALSLQAENLAVHDLPREARSRLEAMQAGLLRARALVSQLLLMARTQLAPRAEPHDIDLQAIVREVFEEILPLAEAKNIDLGVAQACELKVKGDPVELATVLRNLADNAVRYCAPGSKVDVGLSLDASWAVIEVSDNGPGIPDAERAKVFDPFYRVTGTGESGSGLGLSIVKNIVGKLAGKVSISGANGGGTLVRVWLPLASHS
ncbi:MAG TPA: ATP-binding protein [Burkholderiaceae bacterium]